MMHQSRRSVNHDRQRRRGSCCFDAETCGLTPELSGAHRRAGCLKKEQSTTAGVRPLQRRVRTPVPQCHRLDYTARSNARAHQRQRRGTLLRLMPNRARVSTGKQIANRHNHHRPKTPIRKTWPMLRDSKCQCNHRRSVQRCFHSMLFVPQERSNA